MTEQLPVAINDTVQEDLDQAHRLIFQLDALTRFLELDVAGGEDGDTLEGIMRRRPLGHPISNVSRIMQSLLGDLLQCLGGFEKAVEEGTDDD